MLIKYFVLIKIQIKHSVILNTEKYFRKYSWVKYILGIVKGKESNKTQI
jgi:hypothetical protein